MKEEQDLSPIEPEFVDGKMTINEFKKQLPTSNLGQTKVIVSIFWGYLVFLYLKFRFNPFIRSFKPLAEHLERQVFPDLLKKRHSWLELKPAVLENGENILIGNSETTNFNFPGTARFVHLMERRNIKKILLNTHLESNQIVESLLIFLLAFPYISKTTAKEADFWTWQPKKLAAAMQTSDGFHRFCADISFNSENGTLKINYTYCELFMGKLIKKYAQSFTSFSDHRAYFSLASKLFILFFLVFSLPLILMLNGYQIWFLIWIPGIVFPPLIGWGTMQTFGAMQYEREYKNQLLNEYLRQEKVLSNFPAVNPNPVYKISAKGKILYQNPAAEKLLGHSELNLDSAFEILPDDYQSLIGKCLDSQKVIDMELCAQNRVFRYFISPFLEDQTVLFVGNDITHLRKDENDLKDINTNLESQVELRTNQLQLTQDATIQCLGGLAEVRDPETGEHIERTRLYVRILAIELSKDTNYKSYLTDARIDKIYKSAPLHDIGKVGIPDAILLKPGQLTKDEFAIMKLHTTYGADALKSAVKKLGFSSFLDIACEIAAYHHEKWDGTGYPNATKGEDIPLSARIMAVADVYDALISKRVYKPAFSHEKARKIILAQKGTHFDPLIIDIFVAVEDEFKAIAAEFPDQE